jgi:hypothetical protein
MNRRDRSESRPLQLPPSRSISLAADATVLMPSLLALLTLTTRASSNYSGDSKLSANLVLILPTPHSFNAHPSTPTPVNAHTCQHHILPPPARLRSLPRCCCLTRAEPIRSRHPRLPAVSPHLRHVAILKHGLGMWWMRVVDDADPQLHHSGLRT